MDKKPACIFVLLVLTLICVEFGPVPVKATPDYEDYTTYTEVDPNSHVEILNSTHISFEGLTRSESAYVYKDYGSGFFGDFVHYIDIFLNDSESGHHSYPWSMWNILGDRLDNRILEDGLSCGTLGASSTRYNIAIWEMDHTGDSSYNEYSDSMSSVDYLYTDTWYYLTIERDGTDFYCRIYTDSDRTSLHDTLYLSLHFTTTFRYIYGLQTATATGSQDSAGYFARLDLHLLVYATVYFTDGGEFRINNGTYANGTEIEFWIGSVIELGALPSNRTYRFLKFTYDSTDVWTNPYNYTINANVTLWAIFEYIGFLGPVARFTFSPSNPVPEESVLFNGSSSYDIQGSIVSYMWNFGYPISAYTHSGGSGWSWPDRTYDNDLDSVSSVINPPPYPGGTWTAWLYLNLSSIADYPTVCTLLQLNKGGDNLEVWGYNVDLESWAIISDITGSGKKWVNSSCGFRTDTLGLRFRNTIQKSIAYVYEVRLQYGGITWNYTFLESGTYNVTLTVTDDSGYTDSFSQILIVEESELSQGFVIGGILVVIFGVAFALIVGNKS